MSVKNISSAILGVGVDDTTIDLFESQYPVPTGVSYNSYVIRDEKIAILDTVDDLRRRGVHYEFHAGPWGHEWQFWRLQLHDFAQRIFK